MTMQSTNYYGYDKATYEDCRELIDETNRRHIHILNVWFFIINVFCAAMSVLGLFSANQSDLGLYLVYSGVFAVACLVTWFLRNKLKKSILTVMVFLNIALWILYSINISVDQPYMAATMFMVILVVISFSFITTMAYMVGIILLCVAAFLFSSVQVKPATIAGQDVYNVIIYMMLAIVLHFAFQRTRMQQFVTFQKNIQIQRELEIKSSFDALTSLLNRGRFFSLAGNILSNPHDEYMAICLLDLDEFKQINDRLGHQMGDKAIQIAGSTIIDVLNIDMSEKWAFQEKVLKENCSFPGRLGGDEFIVFIRGKTNREEVTGILKKMLEALNQVDMGELQGIQASFGVTEITERDHDIDIAYKRADEALYESKRAGKNQIRFKNAEIKGGAV